MSISLKFVKWESLELASGGSKSCASDCSAVARDCHLPLRRCLENWNLSWRALCTRSRMLAVPPGEEKGISQPSLFVSKAKAVDFLSNNKPMINLCHPIA